MDVDGNTLLQNAVSKGNPEIVKILAPLIEDPNSPNNQGKTPIQEAFFNGNIEIVKILGPLTHDSNQSFAYM